MAQPARLGTIWYSSIPWVERQTDAETQKARPWFGTSASLQGSGNRARPYTELSQEITQFAGMSRVSQSAESLYLNLTDALPGHA